MKKQNNKQAKQYLNKLRKIVSKAKEPFSNLNEEEIIIKLRKTREEIWEEKLAPRP